MNIRNKIIQFYSTAFEILGIQNKIFTALSGRSILFILAYHRVHYDILESHIIELKKHFKNFVSLDECLGLDNKLNIAGASIAITFDDGYKDIIEDAVIIGKKYNIPMTFYLPTNFINTAEPYWFMKLPILFKYLEKRTYNILGSKIIKGNDTQRFLHKVGSYIHKVTPSNDDLNELIINLSQHSNNNKLKSIYRETPKPIGWNRIIELSKDSLFTFGSHTVTHPFLNTLDSQGIVNEFVESKDIISRYTNSEINHFCYPYGSLQAIGSDAPAICQNYYQTAVTMVRGPVLNGDNFSMLKRIAVYEKDSPEIVLTKICHEGLKGLKRM